MQTLLDSTWWEVKAQPLCIYEMPKRTIALQIK